MEPILAVGIQLVLLFVLMVPLGLLLLRGGERLLHRCFRLSTPERLLAAFYAAGCLFLLLAWIPLPLYALPTILGALVVGVLGYALLSVRERAAGLRDAARFVARWPAGVLALLTVTVLAAELSGVGNLVVGNMLDGSAQSLWLNLLLRNHTAALTLSPYAVAGVEYPQGVTVWMSQPVVLFGWPVIKAPLYVPPLFLALSVPGAYCLGERWARFSPSLPAAPVGLVFAAAFALIVAFRGMLVGGTFDYAFGLPLFLVVLGGLPALSERVLRSGKDLVALSLFIGVVASIGPMLGAYLLLFLGAFGLVRTVRSATGLARWATRWVASILLSSVFLLRSIATVFVWYSHPDHVLSDAGSPPYVTASPPTLFSLPNLNGQIDPFIPAKAELSPFAGITLELQILLAAGVVILLVAFLWPKIAARWALPRGLGAIVVAATLVALLETTGLLLLYSLPKVGAGIASVTYLQESSQSLFFFYTLIALLPLVAAIGWVRERGSSDGRPTADAGAVAPPEARRWRRPEPTGRGTRWVTVGSVLLIGIPLASGAYVAAVVGPGYIAHHIGSLANVSEGDLQALDWAGSNLPTCSRVLVAPGSVGMYLPEFAEVHLVFPGYPAPTNLSYSLIVEQLVHGAYSNATRTMLLGLGITEVLVSGQNSRAYPPFLAAPLESSSDFAVLATSGDVTILEFLPGVQTSHCEVVIPPTG